MPSSSWKQHRLMTAVEHDPAFARKVGIPQRVGADFAQADNRAGITKQPDRGRAERHDRKLVAAERRHDRKSALDHADGGPVESALEQFTGSPMHSSHSMMPHGPNIGYMTHLKMPYVPIAGITHNVFAHLKGVSERLPKMQAKLAKSPNYRYKFDVGGEVRLGADAISAIKDAISHIANRDASSAAAALTTNRAAMAHPVVAQAAQALRRGQGIGPAAQALTGLVNADTERVVMPTFRRGGRLDPRRGRR
jgi:hypothetical protein